MKTIKNCTDLKELTPTIASTFIKKIYVHNAEKVDGRKKVKIDIEFAAVGLIGIPDEKELLSLMDEIRNKKCVKKDRSGATAMVTSLLPFKTLR